MAPFFLFINSISNQRLIRSLDPLLKNYPVRIREVTVGVILSISFLFYLFPRFLGEAEKITTTFQEEIETFDIPQTEQMKIPEPPARPSVPIASEDEFFDEDLARRIENKYQKACIITQIQLILYSDPYCPT